MKYGNSNYRPIWFTGVILLAMLAIQTTRAQVIPAPLEMNLTDEVFTLNHTTGVYTNLEGTEKSMLLEYLQSLPYDLPQVKAKTKKNVIRLIVTGDTLQNKEGYRLSVTPKAIEVTAVSGSGLFYGIQTLLQLSVSGDNGSLEIPCGEINDTPRFGYRGFLFDVSRHFFPKDFILRILDVLAYYKLNVFHFHFADSGGWRIEMDNYPELTQMTAYRRVEKWREFTVQKRPYCPKDTEGAYGGYYTKDEIREIIRYAACRNILVIPEVDMPGHSPEVLCAYPELACEGTDYHQSNELCTGKEATFAFCEGVLKEVMELFPSPYIHLGGDEASRERWAACGYCKRRMETEGIESPADLQNYFTNRMEAFLSSHGRTMIGWDEILDGDVAKEAVVMSWRPEANGGQIAVERGHRVIMCPTSYCYLDYYQDNEFFDPKKGRYVPLRKTYSLEPVPPGVADTGLVLGVQGNLWTEQVNTYSDVAYMAFPRLLAVAEVGWTRADLKDYPDFHLRALNALEYLKGKGFEPFPLWSEVGEVIDSSKPLAHLAVDKPVTPVSGSMENLNVLTDGLLCHVGADGLFTGVQGNLDVVIDLGQTTNIYAVKGVFVSDSLRNVTLPEVVRVWASTDGLSYDLLVDGARIDYNQESTLYFSGWVGKGKARYIRYEAIKPENSDGVVLCGEIVIR